MALAANLIDGKRFTAAQWSQALGDEIRQAESKGEPDDGETYYTCALRALERLSQSHGLLERRELLMTRQAWIEAYESTPHGQPVRLPGQKDS
jgi:hypothetical protein